MLVQSYDHGRKEVVHRAVMACLCPLYAVEGMHVITVEGIGSTAKGLHPLQKSLAHSHGTQCGFCSPGFVMSMYALLRSKGREKVTEEEIQDALAGNLCRCTGYRPIVSSFTQFAGAYADDVLNGLVEVPDAALDGDVKVCPSTGKPCSCSGGGCSNNETSAAVKGDLIFPPALVMREPVAFVDHGELVVWYAPKDLDEAMRIMKDVTDATLVCGHTSRAIRKKAPEGQCQHLIFVGKIPELTRIDIQDEYVTIGAANTVADLSSLCIKVAGSDTLPEEKKSFFRAIQSQLKWFASPAIRNTGSLGGNLTATRGVSDLVPLFIAAGAVYKIASPSGQRSVAAADFYLDTGGIDLQAGEVLVDISLPFSRPFEYLVEFKQAQRRGNAFAIVNSGMRVWFENQNGSWLVKEACIAYCGVSSSVVSAKNTSEFLKGKELSSSILEEALNAIKSEVDIPENAMGGMVDYRKSLVVSFLKRGLARVSNQLQQDTQSKSHAYKSPLDSDLVMSVDRHRVDATKGLQYFDASGGPDAAGKPYPHQSAELHTTGEAVYIADMPLPTGTLHAWLILSEKPHANIKAIDTTAAMEVPGVVSVHLARDIPGINLVGCIVVNEEMFASETVTCVGHMLGVVAAETLEAAKKGASAVKIDYEELEPIFSIEEAIEKNSTLDCPESMLSHYSCGDVDAAFAEPGLIITEGEFRLGGQEHFYIEPHGHLVVPGEEDEIVVHGMTQCPETCQTSISRLLGIPNHKVNVKVKRVGGGFGGKETRSNYYATAAAIAAYYSRRPVSILLDRQTDLQITGKRHPFLTKYKAACTPDGKIVACDIQLFLNGGNTLDATGGTRIKALIGLDSAYKIPHFRAQGTLCKTNLPSNTAFRGFGTPEATFIMENILEKLSKAANMDYKTFLEVNLYKDGDTTPYGQLLTDFTLRDCWNQAIEKSQYEERRIQVDEFNKKHKYLKRGLSVVPLKYGIGYETLFLNAGGATVRIYQEDGTVLVSHGGVELGQGLNTKISQLVAHELGVPFASVICSERSTGKIPNASPTSGSMTSDLNGAAAVNACRELMKGLKPVMDEMPNASFKEVVQEAYQRRISLCAHGFYSTPEVNGIGNDRPLNYYTNAVAVTEVEVDTLTGDYIPLRTDIVFDVGRSINPAIDIGQIEGGFVQGMGWTTTEELVWGDNEHPWIKEKGKLYSTALRYKIPNVFQIPKDFRVTLIRNAGCPKTPLVYRSKAIGEPPFCLGTSVFWAIKDAIYARRKESGALGWTRMDSPCTPERVRMACDDDILQLLKISSVVPEHSC